MKRMTAILAILGLSTSMALATPPSDHSNNQPAHQNGNSDAGSGNDGGTTDPQNPGLNDGVSGQDRAADARGFGNGGNKGGKGKGKGRGKNRN